MTIHFTSDLHFFHKKILEFCPNSRPCANLTEMHDTMMYNWNQKVRPEDDVFILGDVTFGGFKPTKQILEKLNGTLHLILGNHDNERSMKEMGVFASVQHYKEVKIEDTWVVMFHYPIHEWRDCHRGTFHLFGHVHGRPVARGRSMDVGIDTRTDMSPYSWEEIKETLSKKEIIKHHEKADDSDHIALSHSAGITASLG